MLFNSLVVFKNNSLLLLGCGFKCILRHSQRLLFGKVYIFRWFKCWFEVQLFWIIVSTLKNLHKTLKFYKKIVLSELNPSGFGLISTSYFSFLTHFGYMVIAIPIHLSVYNSVCVCVCVNICKQNRNGALGPHNECTNIKH